MKTDTNFIFLFADICVICVICYLYRVLWVGLNKHKKGRVCGMALCPLWSLWLIIGVGLRSIA